MDEYLRVFKTNDEIKTNNELEALILKHFQNNVTDLNAMNGFAAFLRTQSSFLFGSLQKLYRLVVCACCNEYGEDKGTVKIIDLTDISDYSLIYPNDIFITDISYVKYDNGKRINTIYEWSQIADNLIKKYNINMVEISQYVEIMLIDDIKKYHIEDVIKILK